MMRKQVREKSVKKNTQNIRSSLAVFGTNMSMKRNGMGVIRISYLFTLELVICAKMRRFCEI